MKTEKHYAVILYPRSTTSYIAVEAGGHPQIFSSKISANKYRESIINEKFEPRRNQTKVARVTISYQ